MKLLQYLESNSSTFHLRTKEEIDQLFNELSVHNTPIDKKLDFYIRVSIQNVKLQLYYELKLDKYRQSVNSTEEVICCESTSNLAVKEEKKITTSTKIIRKKKARKKTTSTKTARKKKTSLEEEDERRAYKTKEQLIAENRARIAKFHPDPDLDKICNTLYQSRKKIEYEKEMEEKNKSHRVFIISIPMGGLNR